MVFPVLILIFCLETTVRENNLMRTTSVTVMVIFYESVILKVKVLSQRLRGTLTTPSERHLTAEDFTDMDQHRCRVCPLKNFVPRHLTY